MTGLVKVLLGVGAAAITVGAVGLLSTSTAKKDDAAKIVKEIKDVAEEATEDKSVIKRITQYVKKKVRNITIKFLAWVALHMEQIEAASAVIGLVTGGLGIATAIRDFKNGNDLNERLCKIEDHLNAQDKALYVVTDHMGNYIYECSTAVNDNIKETDHDVIVLADHMGVKIIKEDEVVKCDHERTA